MVKNKKLIKNTSMLYILTFSNYFFGLVTVPYLTRVLGPETYGRVGVGQAFSTYVQLVLDFGFILSATAEIAENKEDRDKVSRVFYSVLFCKIILIAISLIIVFGLIAITEYFRADWKLFLLFWLYIAVNSFIPDFLYRGLEKMEIITIRTVLLKSVFTVLVFMIIKDKSQYLLVPIFYALGALFSVIFVFYDIFWNIKLKWVKITLNDVIGELKNSGLFFVSRIAGTVYSALNMLILGAIIPGSPFLGYYSASEKLLVAGRGAITPLTDSLYPHMVRERNYRLAKRIIAYGTIVLTIGCVIVGIFAKETCVLVFGAEYEEGAVVLRLMLPLIVTALPNYVIAFPVLTPLGMAKYANIAVIIGAVVQIVGIGVLYLYGTIDVISICILTIITEIIVLSIRCFAAYVGWKRMKKNSDGVSI